MHRVKGILVLSLKLLGVPTKMMSVQSNSPLFFFLSIWTLILILTQPSITLVATDMITLVATDMELLAINKTTLLKGQFLPTP